MRRVAVKTVVFEPVARSMLEFDLVMLSHGMAVSGHYKATDASKAFLSSLTAIAVNSAIELFWPEW